MNFVVTISGFQMGPTTAGAVAVNVQTSSDTEASVSVSSGGIFGQVSSVLFHFDPSDRIAAKVSVPLTLSFTSITALPIGGSITLCYPTGFFGAAVPTVPVGSSTVVGFSGTCSIVGDCVHIVTAGAAIPPSAFLVTMTGFAMGNKNAGSVGVTVSTSADVIASVAVESGGIYTRVSALTFVIDSADRIAFKTSVPVTVGFTPATLLPIGSTITLTYPTGFFVSFISPVFSSSNVAGLTAACGASTSTRVVVTTAGAVIPAAPFVVTLRCVPCVVLNLDYFFYFLRD
jgi:hypothetical protein